MSLLQMALTSSQHADKNARDLNGTPLMVTAISAFGVNAHNLYLDLFSCTLLIHAML